MGGRARVFRLAAGSFLFGGGFRRLDFLSRVDGRGPCFRRVRPFARESHTSSATDFIDCDGYPCILLASSNADESGGLAESLPLRNRLRTGIQRSSINTVFFEPFCHGLRKSAPYQCLRSCSLYAAHQRANTQDPFAPSPIH